MNIDLKIDKASKKEIGIILSNILLGVDLRYELTKLGINKQNRM